MDLRWEWGLKMGFENRIWIWGAKWEMKIENESVVLLDECKLKMRA